MIPMPPEVVTIVRNLARRQKANPGLVFADCNQVADLVADDTSNDDSCSHNDRDDDAADFGIPPHAADVPNVPFADGNIGVDAGNIGVDAGNIGVNEDNENELNNVTENENDDDAASGSDENENNDNAASRSFSSRSSSVSGL